MIIISRPIVTIIFKSVDAFVRKVSTLVSRILTYRFRISYLKGGYLFMKRIFQYSKREIIQNYAFPENFLRDRQQLRHIFLMKPFESICCQKERDNSSSTKIKINNFCSLLQHFLDFSTNFLNILLQFYPYYIKFQIMIELQRNRFLFKYEISLSQSIF